MPTTMEIGKDVFIQQRLGPTVLAKALALEASDPTIAAFRFMLDNAPMTVILDNPYTIGGVQMLAQKGIITADEATAVLAPLEVPDPPPPTPEPAPDTSGWSTRVVRSIPLGAQLETQVQFICATDDSLSFIHSFVHVDTDSLKQQVLARIVAAMNPPKPVPPGTVLDLTS